MFLVQIGPHNAHRFASGGVESEQSGSRPRVSGRLGLAKLTEDGGETTGPQTGQSGAE